MSEEGKRIISGLLRKVKKGYSALGKSKKTIGSLFRITKGGYFELKEDKKIKTTKGIYINREISWLKFNERVLEEARDENNPLCERLSFLSIYQTNLDEFFMVRVGSLEDQKLLNDDTRENKTNLNPNEQIDEILKQVKILNEVKDKTYFDLMKKIENHGVKLVRFQSLSKDDARYIRNYYMQEIVPLLSVMIVGRKQPFPFLKNGYIYALAVLEKKGKKKLGIIPCDSEVLPRMISVPGMENTYMLLEELILHFISSVFEGYEIHEKSLLRVTRNADIDVHKVYDEDLNYRDQMEQVVKLRKKLAPVRLELTRNINSEMLEQLCGYCEIEPKQVFYSKSPLDLSFVFKIQDLLRGNQSLFFEKRMPQQSPDVSIYEPMIPQIQKRDILLSYPYESIRPFLRLLQEAARDPDVYTIKMTLYRLARNSKVVEALAEAAENGKQVDVLVELKARFDEKNNIEWSRRLEDAGCHVVYGIDGLKVHSKLCLIMKKTENGIRYITQVGTGNYNENTARLYTDLCLITSDESIGKEAADVFRKILIGDMVKTSKHLLVAPKCLQKPILDMIDEEINEAKNDRDAYIGVKINSLTDKKIIDKLVEASCAGVKIELIVRGICCLLSGIDGKTDNIKIRSIVGRFLEHSRIYIFGTPDRDKIYISSADYMTRNTLRRAEVAAPVYDNNLKERIRNMFNIMMNDNIKARTQLSDGSYKIISSGEEPINSQEYFYEQSYIASKNKSDTKI